MKKKLKKLDLSKETIRNCEDAIELERAAAAGILSYPGRDSRCCQEW